MTGKSHIAANAATAFLAADAYLICTEGSMPSFVRGMAEHALAFAWDPGGMPVGIYAPVGILLYILGSVLPDTDHPYSPIGKRFHVPVAHRTWMHAIYIPAALMIAGIWFRWLFWLGLGYFLHLFWDGFSRSGIHWFYPRKGKHRLKLYYTGQASEYVFVTLIWLAAVMLFAFWIRQRFP